METALGPTFFLDFLLFLTTLYLFLWLYFPTAWTILSPLTFTEHDQPTFLTTLCWLSGWTHWSVLASLLLYLCWLLGSSSAGHCLSRSALLTTVLTSPVPETTSLNTFAFLTMVAHIQPNFSSFSLFHLLNFLLAAEQLIIHPEVLEQLLHWTAKLKEFTLFLRSLFFSLHYVVVLLCSSTASRFSTTFWSFLPATAIQILDVTGPINEVLRHLSLFSLPFNNLSFTIYLSQQSLTH